MVVLAACSNGDDSEDGNGDANETENGSGDVAPADDGTAPGIPDVSQEVSTTVSEDGNVGLVVNGVHQEDDVVTVWMTLTNEGEDEYDPGRSLVDPTVSRISRTERGDASGIHLIDWKAGKAYYPMTTVDDDEDDERCLCSRVSDIEIEPGESASIFAMFNGVGALEGGTLVVPTFLPADGLSPS